MQLAFGFTERDEIFNAIMSAGGEPVYVGGYVRDTVLGIPCKDFDIEVYGINIQTLQFVLERFGKVSTVGQRFGIVKLTTEQDEYDFSLPRKDNKIGVGRSGFTVEFNAAITKEEAAQRRDFTFNSMFMSVDGIVYDPYNGQEDLRKKILRHTSNAFTEDPTRVLRGMRFCGQLNLHVCTETANLCKSIIEDYSLIEPDMIWQEWEKWALRSICPSRGLNFLSSSGWITHYPELNAIRYLKQDQEWHPEGSVWQHTKYVVDQMNTICDRDGVIGDEKIVHMFGALLHDVGKAVTTTKNAEGRFTSPGHDEAGIEIAKSFLQRIHAPMRFHAPIIDMIRFHMRHINGSSPKVARRMLSAMTITPEQWLRMVEADHSGRPPLPKGVPQNAADLFNLMKEVQSNYKVEKLVMGRHLIEHGYTPSPMFGYVLNQVYQIQIEEGLPFDELLSVALQMIKEYSNYDWLRR